MKVVNENNCVVVKKERTPFDFEYDIKEYFDLNNIDMINNILDRESMKVHKKRFDYCWIYDLLFEFNFSSYEQTISETLIRFACKNKKKAPPYKNCLTENHFTAAYTLNHYFYHNYRNSERFIDTFAKAIAVDSSFHIDKEADIDTWLEDWDSMGGSTIYGATRATGQLAKELTDEELENIVGTDLLPYAKYVLNEGFMFFLDICRSFYRDREDILNEMIPFFFEDNRGLMVGYIKEKL